MTGRRAVTHSKHRRAFLGFRSLSERAAQWLDLRTGSALLAQQPREFGRRGISALANEANILEMAHKVAAKIKDIPVADRRDLLSGRRCWKGCFADSLRPWVRTAERRNASKPRPAKAERRCCAGRRHLERPAGQRRALWFYPTTEVRAVLSELGTSSNMKAGLVGMKLEWRKVDRGRLVLYADEHPSMIARRIQAQ